MSHFRITILGMIGLVAMLGFWLVSLLAGTAWWTTAASTVTLAILLSSLLAAYHLRGLDKTYWSGFAFFGITYLILVNWDWLGGQFSRDLMGGLSNLAEIVFPPDPAPPRAVFVPPGMAAAPSNCLAGDALDRYKRHGNFVQIGRMGLTLLFAILGGLIARFLAARGAQVGAASATIARGADGSSSPAHHESSRASL